MTGQERHIREMIKGQEQKIAKAQKKIDELNEALFEYLTSIPEPIAPPKDQHNYCGKILYTVEKAAHSARKLINRDLIKMGKEPMKRAYFCHRCEAWHLTSMPFWMPYPENETKV